MTDPAPIDQVPEAPPAPAPGRFKARLRVYAVIVGSLVVAAAMAGGLIWMLAWLQTGRYTVIGCALLGVLALAHASFYGRHRDRRPPWHAGAAVLVMAVAWFMVMGLGVERLLGCTAIVHELASQATWLLAAGCAVAGFAAAIAVTLARPTSPVALAAPADPAAPPL